MSSFNKKLGKVDVSYTPSTPCLWRSRCLKISSEPPPPPPYTPSRRILKLSEKPSPPPLLHTPSRRILKGRRNSKGVDLAGPHIIFFKEIDLLVDLLKKRNKNFEEGEKIQGQTEESQGERKRRREEENNTDTISWHLQRDFILTGINHMIDTLVNIDFNVIDLYQDQVLSQIEQKIFKKSKDVCIINNRLTVLKHTIVSLLQNLCCKISLH